MSFSRPPGFDALAHLALAVATLPRAFAAEILLATDMETARREVIPAAGVLEPTAFGVLLRSEIDDLDWFARELARLPFEIEIRRPEELRGALAAHGERLLRWASLRPDPAVGAATSGGASRATYGGERGSRSR